MVTGLTKVTKVNLKKDTLKRRTKNVTPGAIAIVIVIDKQTCFLRPEYSGRSVSKPNEHNDCFEAHWHSESGVDSCFIDRCAFSRQLRILT